MSEFLLRSSLHRSLRRRRSLVEHDGDGFPIVQHIHVLPQSVSLWAFVYTRVVWSGFTHQTGARIHALGAVSNAIQLTIAPHQYLHGVTTQTVASNHLIAQVTIWTRMESAVNDGCIGSSFVPTNGAYWGSTTSTVYEYEIVIISQVVVLHKRC